MITDTPLPPVGSMAVPAWLLRVLLLAAALAAWATTGVPVALTQAPAWAAVAAIGALGLSVLALVRDPGGRLPAGFLLAVLLARLVLTPVPQSWPETIVAVAFVAAAVACHSLAGLCAVLPPGAGDVAVGALLPGAGRLAVVTAAASAALALPVATGAVSGRAVVVVVVVAAAAMLAVIAVVTSAGRRR